MNELKPINSVQHALKIFEVFRTNIQKDEFGVTELSNILGLHKNKVFRLLATLSGRGYIEQNPETENYRLSTSIFNIGQKFMNKVGFLKAAKPFMEKISFETGEACYLGILRNASVIYLNHIESEHAVRVVSRVGKEAPAYATAIGKVQLAYFKDKDIDLIYKDYNFHKYTPNTIGSLLDLKKELREIEVQGYALDREELEYDVKCIAVPIWDVLGFPVAGINVSGPTYRLSDDKLFEQILPTLQKYSKEISKRMGYKN